MKAKFFFLLPLLAFGQVNPDAVYLSGQEVDSIMLGGVKVWGEASINNLYTNLDAANPNNETNAATGWSGNGGNTYESTTEQVFDGTYSIKFTSANTGDSRAALDLSGLAIGVSTTVSFHVYSGQGTDWELQLPGFDGWNSTVSVAVSANGQWVQVQATGTPNRADPSIRIREASSNVGDFIYVDNAIVTQ